MNQKLRAAVYGFAVGDALGVPFEFKSRDSFSCSGMIGGGTWGEPEGTWSDDTSMLLATTASIRETGRIDPDDMMQRYCDWYENAAYSCNGDVFDIGMTTRRSLNRYLSGVPSFLCGEAEERSNGNGALMRILPLAFTNATDAEADTVGALTHAHEISKLCCRNYIAAARSLIQHGELPQEWTERMQHEPRKQIQSTGYVVHSLSAAIWCIVNTENYADAVLAAVNLGGDTDTIAALTGGLAGIRYGIDEIPKIWLQKLRGKDEIERWLF